MEGWMVALFVPTIVFLCIVAPVWIFMHYKHKQQTHSRLSETERHELEVLTQHAERMLDRIETLEAILDSETPQWRSRIDSAGKEAGPSVQSFLGDRQRVRS